MFVFFNIISLSIHVYKKNLIIKIIKNYIAKILEFFFLKNKILFIMTFRIVFFHHFMIVLKFYSHFWTFYKRNKNSNLNYFLFFIIVIITFYISRSYDKKIHIFICIYVHICFYILEKIFYLLLQFVYFSYF